MADGTTPDSSLEAHQLVYRFLVHHGYRDAAAALDREAAAANPRITCSRPVSSTAGHDLQDVVDDWIANRLARLQVDDPTQTLKDRLDQLELASDELPRSANGVGGTVRTAIRDASNVLCVKRARVPRREWDSHQLRFVSEETQCLLTTAVDRTLKVYRTDGSFELLESFNLPSPALSIAQHPAPAHARFVACATMEGSVSVIDLVSRQVVTRVQDHTKYIVRIAFSPAGKYLASLGYDRLIRIYRLIITAPASEPSDDESDDPLATCPEVSLELVHTIHTRTNPEGAVWLPADEARDEPWLVYSAREDNLLHYVQPPRAGARQWATQEWNLNENGDSFISFSVLSITLHPTLPLLSLQTSTASARILLYPFHSATRLLTLHTSASQSDYFNPRHAWLPSGAAVVVNSEDGVVRLVDLRGNVRLFQGAHGIAAPDEELDQVALAAGGAAAQELKSERARLRREADKGSSVVRDVEVLPALEDDKGQTSAAGWRIVSCGFDKTVKVIG